MPALICCNNHACVEVEDSVAVWRARSKQRMCTRQQTSSTSRMFDFKALIVLAGFRSRSFSY